MWKVETLLTDGDGRYRRSSLYVAPYLVTPVLTIFQQPHNFLSYTEHKKKKTEKTHEHQQLHIFSCQFDIDFVMKCWLIKYLSIYLSIVDENTVIIQGRTQRGPRGSWSQWLHDSLQLG